MRYKKSLVFIATTLVVIAIGAFLYHPKAKTTEPVVIKPNIRSATQATAPTTSEFFALVNEERAKVSVKPLVLDERLNQSAQMKADELVREGRNANPHINNSGVHGTSYAHQLVSQCHTASENLLFSPTTAREGVWWWLSSKPHREAMLLDRWEITGFAISGGYVVEHFCDLY